MKLRLLGIFLGTFSAFLSSNLSLIIWNNLFFYYLLIVLAGLISGIILVNMERALIIYLATFSLAFLVSVWLSILPSYFIGSTEDIDFLVAIITTTLSRHVIISFPACIITGLFGCFIGNSLEGGSYQ